MEGESPCSVTPTSFFCRCLGCTRSQVHVHKGVVIGPCPILRMQSQKSVGGAQRCCRCCEVAVASALLACVGSGSLAERRAWASAAPSHLSAIEEQMQPPTSSEIESSLVLPAQASEFTARELSLRSQVAECRRVAEQQAVRPEKYLRRLSRL